MIKYRLECEDCKGKFDSWFSSSKEFDKLKKLKLINCNSCNSKNSLIAYGPGVERVTEEIDIDIVVPFNAIEIGKKISDNIESKFIILDKKKRCDQNYS